MNCTNHQEWLQEYLDGTAPTDTGPAAEHRTSCAVCRELFAAAQRLLAGVRQLHCATPPADLPCRIVRAVLADRRRTLVFRRVAVVGALAASLLLALWLARPYFRADAPPGNREVVEDPKVSGPSLEASLQEGTTALVEVTRRTTDETVGQTRLLTALVPEVPLPDTQALLALNAPSASLRELQDGVSDGLEPVASSWRRAVDLFRRNIPPMTPPSE